MTATRHLTGTLAKMARPVTVTLPSGDLDVIAGLLIAEVHRIEHDAKRASYRDTLTRMRRLIFQAQEKAGA